MDRIDGILAGLKLGQERWYADRMRSRGMVYRLDMGRRVNVLTRNG